MQRRKLLAVAVSGVLAGGLMSACSNDSSPNAGNNASKAAGATVLKVGIPKGPQQNNQNPFTWGSAAFELGYRWAIYEPLQIWNPAKPDEEPKAWLASGIEWAPDYKSATITVIDNATWSDGQKLTAEDVAFTYNMVKKDGALNGYGTKYGAITSTGNTVSIKFADSQYTRKNQLFSQIPIVPKHIWEKVAKPGEEKNTTPVGSGPYTLKTFSPQSAVLAKRESGYWGTAPGPNELQYITFTGNDTLTTALGNGEVDWANVFVPNYQATFVAKDPANNKVWATPQLGVHALYFNTNKAPFNSAALRKAINQVIDRQKIFQVAFGSYYRTPVTNVTGLPTPAADSFIADEFKGQEIPTDVDGAKKILTDAGFTYAGDKLQDPTGKPVSIKLTDPASFTDYQSALTVIQENLKSLGIAATIDKPSYEAWDKDVSQGRFDATMRWSNGGSTPWDIYNTFMEAPKKVGEQTFANYGRFNSPAGQKALAAYSSATNDEARQAALVRLQKLYVAQVPAIAVAADTQGGAYTSKRWTGWPDDTNPYATGLDNNTAPLVLSTLKAAGS